MLGVPCLDNGSMSAQGLQCDKDNDPCVGESDGKKVHLHVRGRK